MVNVQAWIPCQANSTRVPEKNTRSFINGISLLEIKINQLLLVIPSSSIYVSGNSPLTEEICVKKGVNYISRPDELLGNEINQEELFSHFIKNTPKSKRVMWVQVTDPLFDKFDEILSVIPTDNEVVVAAVAERKHAFFNGRPVNFNFGRWHPVTQEIDPILFPRWSAFFANYETFDKYRYHFGEKNRLVVSECEFVDIDTMKDFTRAQDLFNQERYLKYAE